MGKGKLVGASGMSKPKNSRIVMYPAYDSAIDMNTFVSVVPEQARVIEVTNTEITDTKEMTMERRTIKIDENNSLVVHVDQGDTYPAFYASIVTRQSTGAYTVHHRTKLLESYFLSDPISEVRIIGFDEPGVFALCVYFTSRKFQVFASCTNSSIEVLKTLSGSDVYINLEPLDGNNFFITKMKKSMFGSSEEWYYHLQVSGTTFTETELRKVEYADNTNPNVKYSLGNDYYIVTALNSSGSFIYTIKISKTEVTLVSGFELPSTYIPASRYIYIVKLTATMYLFGYVTNSSDDTNFAYVNIDSNYQAAILSTQTGISGDPCSNDRNYEHTVLWDADHGLLIFGYALEFTKEIRVYSMDINAREATLLYDIVQDYDVVAFLYNYNTKKYDCIFADTYDGVISGIGSLNLNAFRSCVKDSRDTKVVTGLTMQKITYDKPGKVCILKDTKLVDTYGLDESVVYRLKDDSIEDVKEEVQNNG